MQNEETSLPPSVDIEDLFASTLRNASLHDVNSEDDFKRTKQNSWKEHSKQYTELLINYVENSKKTLQSKQCQKKWFFAISMMILVLATVSSIIIIWTIITGTSETMDKIISVIPSLLTFFTPLFVIPNLIAKYLFNTKDEEHMIEVVRHIISHDDNSINK